MIANIAGDDGLILLYSANPTGSNFRERQGSQPGTAIRTARGFDVISTGKRRSCTPHMTTRENPQTDRSHQDVALVRWEDEGGASIPFANKSGRENIDKRQLRANSLGAHVIEVYFTDLRHTAPLKL
jgi:hypothetical protein